MNEVSINSSGESGFRKSLDSCPPPSTQSGSRIRALNWHDLDYTSSTSSRLRLARLLRSPESDRPPPTRWSRLKIPCVLLKKLLVLESVLDCMWNFWWETTPPFLLQTEKATVSVVSFATPMEPETANLSATSKETWLGIVTGILLVFPMETWTGTWLGIVTGMCLAAVMGSSTAWTSVRGWSAQ